jgi:hypothetical protein
MASSHESDRPPPTLYSIFIGLVAGGIAGGVCAPLSLHWRCRFVGLDSSVTIAVQVSDSSGAYRAP